MRRNDDTDYYSISLLAEFGDGAHREAAARLLAKDTRPEFDDGLEAWEARIFAQLDGVEYPSEISREGERGLFIHWQEVDETLLELDKKLLRCGGVVCKAQVFLGDPYTDNTDDGMYYKREGEKFRRVDPKEENLRMPSDFAPAPGRPSPHLRALLQEF